MAVADLAAEAVAGFLHGELPVHPPLGNLLRQRVDEREQVQGLGDPAVLDERLPERGGVSVAAEHPQQVVGADLVGDQRPGHAQHVWPLGGDLGDVDRVAGDRLQRAVATDRLLLGPQVTSAGSGSGSAARQYRWSGRSAKRGAKR